MEPSLSREYFRAPDAHILIVDDTRMNLTVAEGLLKSTQIRIDTALSGKEALLLTLSNAYDLILMDQRMPEVDGSEALRLIREQEGGLNRQTPVICLTADAIAGARERYLAEGFTDYLSKPINSRALKKTILEYLPREKIFPAAENDPEKAAPGAEDRFAPLRNAGIDVSLGLSFCQHDDTLYRSILWEYGCSAGAKAECLRKDYDTADWKNYAIRIHALKSTSGTIGATRLSHLAAHLEQAAKQENAEAVRQDHAEMLSLYARTADAILSCCTEDIIPSAEDNGVFEFMPDE